MNIEADLIALNKCSVEMEQDGDKEDRAEKVQDFFKSFLSDQLIFRRAGGDVIEKCGEKGFLNGLKKNPFESRTPEDIAVKMQGSRAVVTLMVVAKRKDDQSVHRFRNVRFFTRSGDEWRLESWYNYEMPEPTPKEWFDEYQEICKSHQAITEFRAKLLGFLPLASGAGLVVLLTKESERLRQMDLIALGVFGCLITAGLFVYELRGIQHCWRLIKRAKDLEQKLGFAEGQFTGSFEYFNKPGSQWPRIRWPGPAAAAYIVYGTVLLSWLFIMFMPKPTSPEPKGGAQTERQGSLTNAPQKNQQPTGGVQR